ncbi:MAG: hypothetical protein ACR2PX_22745 [Endozoicomonas sp.]|uniref:hypothetical protein n=1 Tax=Endozoicomonas sp. TaxID=1892382 RepID=UPI003D9B5A6C
MKTVEASGDDHTVHNQWSESNVDVVVYFARNSNWGVLAPAFTEKKRSLKHSEHRKFMQDRKDFLREFHLLDTCQAAKAAAC